MNFAKSRPHFPRGITTQLESHLFLCIVGRCRRASIAGKLPTVRKTMVALSQRHVATSHDHSCLDKVIVPD